MKLPKFFRTLIMPAFIVFLVLLVLFIILIAIFGNVESRLGDALLTVVGVLMAAAFVTAVGSVILENLIRAVGNALLRSFGQAATATVLDSYDVVSGSRNGRNLVEAVRIKLEVHDPQGGSFTGIAEDSPNVGWNISRGQTVSVKFDPRTREVALDLPKPTQKEARKDF